MSILTIDQAKIGFIGAGNMASSIIGGLIGSGISKDRIFASDPNQEPCEKLKCSFAIQIEQHNTAIAADCNVIILAVKPQVMAEVCQELRGTIKDSSLVISVAAGIDCTSLSAWLGETVSIVRCMPNTPALVGEGASALYAMPQVTDIQRMLAEQIIQAVGSAHWVKQEALLDAVTAVSGSGPAYFFLVLESMIDAGVELGLEKQTATDLAIQTALGAAKLAKESDVGPAELRNRVTSPNGTTERAIASFENNQIRRIFSEAMRDCAARSSELSKELGAKTVL